MAVVLPFKAVRPTRDKVGLLASRSYQSYSKAERRSRLRDNPFSFLHIVNPGYKYHKVVSGKERYSLVRNRYLEFKEDGVFTQDESPCYYVYKIVNRDGLEFNGIAAAASTEDYAQNAIRKHESTLELRETLFMEYLQTVGFNAEPVLLTYPDSPQLDKIIAEVMQERPEYEFTTTYRDTHYLWLVNETVMIDAIKKIFSDIETLYIADGHHRSASSYLLAQNERDNNPDHTGEEPYNFFMSYLIPESDLKIYQFNRLIKDLNGLDTEEFLIALDSMYRIEERGQEYYKPSKKHHFSMYLDGNFYSLFLRKDNYTINNALDNLDTHILYETILKPILGITNLRNNEKIGYSHGKKEMAYVKSLVDSGEYAVGFGLLPVSTKELKDLADEGLVMPPKSTYIEPKLRSGVTIYEF